MSRADMLHGEHLLTTTGSFIGLEDRGGEFPDSGGMATVVRRSAGAALELPRREAGRSQLLWVVSGGAVAPTSRAQQKVLPAGALVALGNGSDTGQWHAGPEGTTVVVFQVPEDGAHSTVDLRPVMAITPDSARLQDLPLDWRGEGPCRRAVLATNANMMTLALLSFGAAIDRLPEMSFPHGEIWVLLWGGAQISTQHYEAGLAGAVGSRACYGPRNVAAGTLVLVYTPGCPRSPEARVTTPWAEAAR